MQQQGLSDNVVIANDGESEAAAFHIYLCVKLPQDRPRGTFSVYVLIGTEGKKNSTGNHGTIFIGYLQLCCHLYTPTSKH